MDECTPSDYLDAVASYYQGGVSDASCSDNARKRESSARPLRAVTQAEYLVSGELPQKTPETTNTSAAAKATVASSPGSSDSGSHDFPNSINMTSLSISFQKVLEVVEDSEEWIQSQERLSRLEDAIASLMLVGEAMTFVKPAEGSLKGDAPNFMRPATSEPGDALSSNNNTRSGTDGDARPVPGSKGNLNNRHDGGRTSLTSYGAGSGEVLFIGQRHRPSYIADS